MKKINTSLLNRRSTRLPAYDYRHPGAYFVTVCAASHQCLLGSVIDGAMRLNNAGRMIQTVWDELPSHYPGVRTDAFIIMPNHVHGIIILVGAGFAPPVKNPVGAGLALPARKKGAASGAPTLGDVVRAFKSLSALSVNRALNRTGPLWQRNYYEHIIRGEESLGQIREYIRTNPALWHEDNENPAAVGAGLALPINKIVGAIHESPFPVAAMLPATLSVNEPWCV